MVGNIPIYHNWLTAEYLWLSQQMSTSRNHTKTRSVADTSDTPTRFTDWREWETVTKRAENEIKRSHLKQRTLSMGNQTEIGLDKENPSAGATWLKRKDFYTRLDQHNRDCWWKWRADVKISVSADNGYKRTLIAAFCGEVGMNSYQRQRAFKQLMELDVRQTGLSVALNSFVICALIVNDDAALYGEDNVYHPQRAPRNNDPNFLRLEESLVEAHPRITKGAITSAYNKLSQNTPQVRSQERWAAFVQRESFVSMRPSYALREFNQEEPPTDDIDR